MPTVLGKIQGWCGGSINQTPAGGPQYWNPWHRFDVNRLLYHSGISRLEDALVLYPYLPTNTKNFTDEWLYGRETQVSKTLTSSVATVHRGYPDDGIVTEIWDPGGGVSHNWMFFHKLYRLWHTEPDRDNNEYLLWRPLDRTIKAYEVEIIGLTVGGSAQEFQAQFSGRTPTKQEGWLTQPVELQLKLVREVPPQMSVQMIGGSTTPETVGIPGN